MGSKIYPQNQVILDCIPFKHKCLSIILIWVIVSHKYIVVVSKKKVKKIFFFFLLFFIWVSEHGIEKKGGFCRLGMVPKFSPLRWAENRLCHNTVAFFTMIYIPEARSYFFQQESIRSPFLFLSGMMPEKEIICFYTKMNALL